jgi:hypothetical protein
MRNITDKIVEKINTQKIITITFSEKRAGYEIVRKNMAHPDRPQMTI